MEETVYFKDKKILVTGGSGFVGTHMVEELLKNGADNIVVPIHDREMIIKDERIATLKANLTDQSDCDRVCQGADLLFHCAGAVSAAGVTAHNPMEAITTNLVLTARILQGAWTAGVGKALIFGSSTAYPAADHPVKEEELWSGPTYETYFGYGWMRRYLERIAEFVSQKSDVEVIITRPTAVYGRYDNFDLKASHVIPALIRRAVEKDDPYIVWGTGDEVRDFLHITDLARGCLMMMEKAEKADPINIGYGSTFTIKEMVKMILKEAGNEEAQLVFDTTKPTTIPFRAVDVGKARRLLGFEAQVSIEEGIKDTVGWYVANKKAADSGVFTR